MHLCGFLHNDIHPGNIMIRDVQYVKLIDFGKVTLLDDPVTYCIKVGSPKHERYNRIYKHLAYELRNVPGCKTDIYSLGYCFRRIADLVKSCQLRKIAEK